MADLVRRVLFEESRIKPQSKNPKIHELYRADHRYQPILKRHNKLEEVFGFRTWIIW